MKKYFLFSALIISLMVTLVLVSGQAGAEPPFEYFEGTQWICIVDYDPSHTKIWETKNTNHGRNGYQWAFGGRPYHFGAMLSTIYWNVNLKKAEGVTWGTFQHDILDESGAWKGAWIGTYTGKLSLADPPAVDIFGNPIFLTAGKTVAHGTGAYEGMEQRTNFWQEAYDPDVVPNPCNDVFNPDGTFPFPLPMFPVIMHVEGREFVGD